MRLKIILIPLLLMTQNLFAGVEEAYQEQRLVLISDYDETLTGKAWNTLWFLKKIPPPKTILQLSVISALIPGATFESLPNNIPVTSREVGELFAEKLAIVESNGKISPRTLELHVLTVLPGTPERANERVFIPGFYRATEESWERFRPSDSISYLLEDNRRSQLLERATGFSRFGIAFPIFRLLTNSRKSIDNIHVVTARVQSQIEFESLFHSWQKEGVIKNIHGQRLSLNRRLRETGSINVYPVGEGMSVLEGEETSERKIRTAKDRIINQYLLLAKQQQKKYVVVIAENDPATVEGYVRMLQELMGIPTYQKHFDFIFLHAGTDFEVMRSGFPGRWTQVTNGALRALAFDDVEFLSGRREPIKQTLKMRTGLACKSLF